MKDLWMKKTAFCLMLGVVLPALAQEHGRQPDKKLHEIPSPEGNARRISKEVKKTFQLTDKQYTEIYELYLKEQKASMPDAAQHNNMPARGGAEHRPPKGGHRSPNMGGGMPPENGGFPPKGNGQPPMDREKLMKEQEKKHEKAYKKLDKKMKKLLNESQYIQWKKWEIERLNTESQPQMPHPVMEPDKE